MVKITINVNGILVNLSPTVYENYVSLKRKWFGIRYKESVVTFVEKSTTKSYLRVVPEIGDPKDFKCTVVKR